MWHIIKILIKDGLIRLTFMDGFNSISDIIWAEKVRMIKDK